MILKVCRHVLFFHVAIQSMVWLVGAFPFHVDINKMRKITTPSEQFQNLFGKIVDTEANSIPLKHMTALSWYP